MWKVVIFLLSTVLGVCLFALFVWRVNNPNVALSVVPDEITLSFSFVGLFLHQDWVQFPCLVGIKPTVKCHAVCWTVRLELGQ